MTESIHCIETLFLFSLMEKICSDNVFAKDALQIIFGINLQIIFTVCVCIKMLLGRGSQLLHVIKMPELCNTLSTLCSCEQHLL